MTDGGGEGQAVGARSGARAVFISYASQDAQAAARICDALRAAGIEVWFDRSELRGGDAWDRQIHERIHDCRLFIAVISANTEARDEGYFRREWKLAVDRTHDMAENKAFLVPVAIDDTPEKGASVPEPFRQVQWSRLPGGKTPQAFVAGIATLLGAGTSHPAGRVGSEVILSAVARSSRASRKYRAWLSVAALMIAVAGGWLAWHHLGNPVPEGHGSDTAGAVATDKSIAVLPFVDMSEKKDEEYFAEGMAEEVLDQLVKVPQLKVISRTSSFQYKDKSTDVRAIGAALGARYLVEGSVRRSGDKLRITAELIDAQDGARRWSDRYDRDIGDVLKVQDEIATSLVRALQVSVGAFELPARSAVRVPAAYDAYLRARRAADQFNRKGFEEALDNYREALRLDPQYSLAAAALAMLQADLGVWGYRPVHTAFSEARASAELAIRLDGSLAMPHAILALTHVVYDWDWQGARQELARAAALQPRDPTTEWVAAQLSAAEGNWDEAISHANASLALDPLFAGTYYELSSMFASAGRLDEAEVAIRKAMQISPSYVWAHYQLGNVLLLSRKPAEALAVFQQEPDPEAHFYGLALANYALGHRQASDAALEQLTQLAASDWAYGIAAAHAYRGEIDQAFTWLDRAYALKDVDLSIFKGNPVFAKIWPDPRYKAFLRKMNLPE
jgi:TolB-like protein